MSAKTTQQDDDYYTLQAQREIEKMQQEEIGGGNNDWYSKTFKDEDYSQNKGGTSSKKNDPDALLADIENLTSDNKAFNTGDRYSNTGRSYKSNVSKPNNTNNAFFDEFEDDFKNSPKKNQQANQTTKSNEIEQKKKALFGLQNTNQNTDIFGATIKNTPNSMNNIPEKIQSKTNLSQPSFDDEIPTLNVSGSRRQMKTLSQKPKDDQNKQNQQQQQKKDNQDSQKNLNYAKPPIQRPGTAENLHRENKKEEVKPQSKTGEDFFNANPLGNFGIGGDFPDKKHEQKSSMNQFDPEEEILSGNDSDLGGYMPSSTAKDTSVKSKSTNVQSNLKTQNQPNVNVVEPSSSQNNQKYARLLPSNQDIDKKETQKFKKEQPKEMEDLFLPGIDTSDKFDKPNTASKQELNQVKSQNHFGVKTQETEVSQVNTIQNQYSMDQFKELQQQQLQVHQENKEKLVKQYEEIYNDKTKQKEEHCDQQIDHMKQKLEIQKSNHDLQTQNYDQQIKQQKESHEYQLEQEKKSKTSMIDEMKQLMKEDKERQKDIFDQEMKQKDLQHELEKKKLKQSLEDDANSLRKQLEQQQKLATLTDEIRFNSNKLNDMTSQLETNTNKINQDEEIVSDRLIQKEIQLKDQESKLRIDQEYVQKEKARLQTSTENLELKEKQLRSEIEHEKKILQREYQRLDDLQKQIQDSEMKKKQELENNKRQILDDKEDLLNREDRLKQQYESKSNMLSDKEMQFDRHKGEFLNNIQKKEKHYNQLIKEQEEIRNNIANREQEINHQHKFMELKNMELQKQLNDVKRNNDLAKLEKLQFEKEQKRVQNYADKIDDENKGIKEFRQNFQLDREKLNKQEKDLQMREAKLRSEKNLLESSKKEAKIMEATVENLKHDFVKDISGQKPLSYFEKAKNELALYQQFQDSQKYKFLSVMPKENNFMGSENDFAKSMNSSIANQIQVNDLQPHGLKQPLDIKDFSNTEKNTYKPFNLDHFMKNMKKMDDDNFYKAAYLNKEKELLYDQKYDTDYRQHHLSQSANTSKFEDSVPSFNKPSFTSEN